MKPTQIIFFASPNCSICDSQDRILTQLAETGLITYQKQMITTAFDLALRYGIKSAPSIVYLQEARPVRVSPGLQSEKTIRSGLKQLQNG